MSSEIMVVPFFGQGHLLPCMELCIHIASRNFKIKLVISDNLSSSIPSHLRHHRLIQIVEIPSSPAPQLQPGSDPHLQHHHHHNEFGLGLDKLLSTYSDSKPLCAIADTFMTWSSQIFNKFQIPMIGFFTSGACSAAMEHAVWKAQPQDLKPGELRLLPGLPEDMAVTTSDLKRRSRGPPRGAGGGRGSANEGGREPSVEAGAFEPKKMRPPSPGDEPPWVSETSHSIALMINTSNDLEHPYIDYLAHQIGKPVWGVGPLLPEQYWKSSGSLLHDHEIRSNRRSSVTEDEVIQWLDSKQTSSVIYVSFGSEVGPTMEEYHELAAALEQSIRPFIWVVQANSGKSGPPKPPGSADTGHGGFSVSQEMIDRFGKKGLVIQGWAPQLLILSHKSTGGFLSHCGWNSTVEAIGRGVPFLAWPIRGDQFYNAKLVVKHLKVGHMICEDMSEMVKKDNIVKGIERLMGDVEMKTRAERLSVKFQNGFPASSDASLDAFTDFVKLISS